MEQSVAKILRFKLILYYQRLRDTQGQVTRI